MFIYLTVAILVIIIGLIIFKIIKAEDKTSKIYLSLLGGSVLIFAAAILFAELNGYQSSGNRYPYIALVPIWISSALAARNQSGVNDRKLSKFLLLATLVGILVLMVLLTLYIIK